MGFCFICNSKLYGERTRVCSSITPHSNVPYPEKIAEVIGEEFVVIVTPADHVCKECSLLITQLDKLEHDLKLVKNSMISHIQKKYDLLPANQSIKTYDVVNGHLKTDELEIRQKKVPSGLNIRNGTMTPLSKMSKPQPNNTSKIKIYKCGFCSFQSKELGHVRFHMRSHMNKKEEVEPTNPPVMKTLTPKEQDGPQQKKRLYRCQVCSLSFDSRISCLEHIQKTHKNQHTTAHEEKKTEEIPLGMSQVFQSEIMKTDSNQLAQTNMYIDQSQQVQTNMYVDLSQQSQTSMYVDQSQQSQTNVYVNQNQQSQTKVYVNQNQQAQTKVYVNQRQQAQTNAYVNHSQQSQPNIYVDQSQQAQTNNMYVNQSQQGTTGVQERTQNTAQEILSVQGATIDINQIIPDNVNGVNLEMVCGENKTDDLDIESMLAAIHNDAS